MTSASMNRMSLGRAALRMVPRYDPAVTACELDLGDNVNLWGAPPAATRAIANVDSTTISRYPSVYSEPLHDAVLGYLGLTGGARIGVVTGCGSDDVLDSAIRAFGAVGDTIAFPAPTFAMIPIFARLNGLVLAPVPMTDGYDVDAQRLVEHRASITYLCTPNNPTSTALARETVEYVVANAAGVVIIDEAYAEFASDTFVSLVAHNERVLVIRTFSKAFGLAGLRIGIGVGRRDLVDVVTRARGPYKVNALAESAALAALADDEDALGWVRRHAKLAVEARERMTRELRAMGLQPLPSAANFLFIPTPRAPALADAMRRRGIQVRALSGLPRDLSVLEASGGHALRIGVGPNEMMQRVLETMREVIACA